MIVLWCRLCDAGYGSVGDLPVTCPTCKKPTRWGTTPPHMLLPANPTWTPSENDRTLLRSLKIDPS